MPRKQYMADLQEAINLHGVDHIHDLEQGDDDGQFRFIFAHAALNQPISVTAGITELSDYPSQHDYFIFAADDTAAQAAEVLATRLPSTAGKSVPQLLTIVSAALLRYVASEGDIDMPDSHTDDEEMESEADYDYDSPGDDDFGVDFETSGDDATAGRKHVDFTLQFRNRIRLDLREAKKAGFKIGTRSGLLDGNSCYISISVRFAKLGISESAMQAWQVKSSEYLILVLHYATYKTLEQLMACESYQLRDSAPKMRVLVCPRYKPSLAECLAAFAVSGRNANTVSGENGTPHDESAARPTFISKSLENLLNERLISMLKYREMGMSQYGAEQFYADNLGAVPVKSSSIAAKYFQPEQINTTYPKIVNNDHWLDSRPMGSSLPLLAMQLLVRHFVRCTEFCVVCHGRLDSDIEAIKPYVCDQGLCLYQYVTMGFGPSFEHEILSQPYVVDLLVSFAYAQTAGGRLKDFPHGLGMYVPKSFCQPIRATLGRAYTQVTSAIDLAPNPNAVDIKFDRARRELLFNPDQKNCPVRLGDWIAITDKVPADSGTVGGASYQCRVIDICHPSVKVGPLFNCCSNPGDKELDSMEAMHDAVIPSDPVWRLASLEVYDTDFDTLPEDVKRGALKSLMDCLPSIPEIKAYLSSQRNPDLAKWCDRIPPSALSVLRWIIASNRACILQVHDQCPETGQPRAIEDHISGMQDWMQFRFAMGAPDKEKRFLKCVGETASRLNSRFPTIFAFHGSSLHNWHSIIREGLNYNDTVNGRAFGHGVYHSLDLGTSLAYSGLYGMVQQGNWPRSILQISTAMALNEIVNAPQEFTSHKPHLVVQHVDWIQTRYLFIKCSAEGFTKFGDTKPKFERPQDKAMRPRNSSGLPLSLPAIASHIGKRSMESPPMDQPKKSKKSKAGKGILDFDLAGLGDSNLDGDDASDYTDQEDVDFLIDEVPTKEVGSTRGHSQTDFVPGSLDHDKLPKFPMPVYATTVATTRLNKDFKALLKVQNTTPLHELGWYIDAEKFECPYQWIVELHSFHTFEENGKAIPLVKDMKSAGLTSIVLEMRFPGSYPNNPPFVRVVKPRFLPFMEGGGGHVTAGGALCMELLTNSGWSPVSSIEAVLLQVRLAIASIDPKPARLMSKNNHLTAGYGVGEAIEAYKRACRTHGWEIPKDFDQMAWKGDEGGRY